MTPPRPVSTRARSALLGACLLAALVLSACRPDAAPSPPPSPPPVAPTQEPVEEPSGPVLVPEGTAEENLPLFAAVTQQVWESAENSQGRAYIDALVAAGFDRSRMQLTEDLTTVGNPVESMQFSVAWGTEHCLIGQVGPSTGEPLAVVLDQLAEGRCLVGNTRVIDW